MYESHCEQRPLLQGGTSDEEFKIQSPLFNRRNCPAYSGRARAKAKGAISVFTHWPGHLSWLLAYLWVGLGMVAITMLIIYNSLSIIGVDPIDTGYTLKSTNRENDIKNMSPQNPYLNVFMHIFVDEQEDISVDNYLLHVKTIAMKYPSFKFNLVIIIDDLPKVINEEINDKRNNDIAFNMIGIDKSKFGKRQWIKNISVQYVSLAKYLDESPLRIHWRNVPRQLMEFLVRCVAIWEKGGVALNPIIVTSKSYPPIYQEKLQHILKKYTKYAKNKEPEEGRKKKYVSIKSKPKHQVNNIRDIINNLEEESEQNSLQFNLTQAENKIQSYLSNLNIKSEAQYSSSSKQIKLENKDENNNYGNEINKTSINKKRNIVSNTQTVYYENSSIEISTNKNLLPMFIEYLFPNKDTRLKNLNKNKTLDTVPYNDNNLKLEKDENEHLYTNARDASLNVNIKNTPVEITENSNTEQNSELIIDLKGNLIATRTSCHAFVGGIFSNIKHHSANETVSDLIIGELSLFCKGILRSCKGIDVIMS